MLSGTLWAAGSALAGLLIAAAAIALPAWREARSLTVAGARRSVDRVERQAAGGCGRSSTSSRSRAPRSSTGRRRRNGYQLVLAPEGVPQIQVNWYAPCWRRFSAGSAAACSPTGSTELAAGPGPRACSRVGLRPLAGELAPTVAATMAPATAPARPALTLVALTVAFAGSTAVFNSTYAQQTEVDARLSNGADVTVTESPGRRRRARLPATQLAAIPGVSSR